jgi:hypothetical protein
VKGESKGIKSPRVHFYSTSDIVKASNGASGPHEGTEIEPYPILSLEVNVAEDRPRYPY